ncbi:MAG: sugar phosphate isomerase/epimerase [Opitutales bacterium]|nr:sugar phosphate isomerase/epimerase [Opitutales bacterium]
MARTITLFTGQWADMKLEELAPLAKKMGYEGLEIAITQNHFDPEKMDDKKYLKSRWDILESNGLNCFALSNHLVGQCVCDNIDSRHRAIMLDRIWGDGDPEGVRRRAAAEMVRTAKVCKKFMEMRPKSLASSPIPPTVTGFTGSSIWQYLYSFPPVSKQMIDAGYADFAKRWTPILNAFDKAGVNFALEVHPTEIAFDIASAERALAAIKNHPRFGFNFDPSHFGYQGVDYVKFIRKFGARIFHAHMKDGWWGHGNGEAGVFGGHTDFCDPRRYWDFRSIGHGDINFEEIIVALNDIGYKGPLSVEWEDGRMDRIHGATESCQKVKAFDFPTSDIAFDSAFDTSNQ